MSTELDAVRTALANLADGFEGRARYLASPDLQSAARDVARELRALATAGMPPAASHAAEAPRAETAGNGVRTVGSLTDADIGRQIEIGNASGTLTDASHLRRNPEWSETFVGVDIEGGGYWGAWHNPSTPCRVTESGPAADATAGAVTAQ